MTIRNNPPLAPNDAIIKFGDTGQAIIQLQSFLQSLSEVQKAQKFLADFNKGFSFTDPNIKGTFERETRLYLSEWQKREETKIKAIGKYDDNQFKIILGTLDWASWKRIQQLQGSITEPVKNPKPQTENKDPESTVHVNPLKASQFKDTTHYVKTVNPEHRLALRYAPAFVKVSKNASEDNDKKGRLVVMMPQDTLLKVITPHVGYNCEWHRVEVIDDNPLLIEARGIQKENFLYAYAEFCQPLNETKTLLPVYCRCIQNDLGITPKERVPPFAPFPDWTKLTECEPFFDEFTCSYYITITTAEKKTNKTLLENQKKKALQTGVFLLLEFYYKQSDPKFIESLMNSYEFATIPKDGWFLDERPNSVLKFLVKIPAKYFDAIPQKSDNLSDIPNISGGQLPENWRTATLFSNTLEDNLEMIAQKFEELDGIVQKWSGRLGDFNLKEEAKRLRMFVPTFKKFLKYNNKELRTSEEDIFEFGFKGKCFDLIYVLMNDKDVFIPLRIGFDCFKNTDPVTYERTMGYVFYSIEMVKDIKKNVESWITFIQQYTCPPVAPSPVPIPNKDPLPPVSDKPIKTTKEKIREDRAIVDIQREPVTPRNDFVADNLFDCENIDDLLNRISTLEDLYANILNKVDIQSVVSFIASCLAISIPIDELRAIACEEVVKRLSAEQLDELITFLPDESILKVRQYEIDNPRLPGEGISSPSENLSLDLRNIIPKEQLCEAINQFDATLISDFLKKLKPPTLEELKSGVKNRLPIVPTFSFPDSLPTEDIMSGLGDILAETIKATLTSVLMGLIKQALLKLCQICSANTDIPLNEMHGEEDLPINPLALPAIFGDNIDADDLMNFFDDLSKLLLPSEICNLLNGIVSDEVFMVIKSLAKEKYPNLLKFFQTKFSIQNIFRELAKDIDIDKFCNKIEEASPKLCDDKELENIRRQMYEGRLTADLIDQNISNIKNRNIQALRHAVDLIDNQSLKGVVKSLGSDSGCSDGVNIRPPDHPSLEKLSDDVSTVMFDQINSVFNNDVENYLFSLKGLFSFGGQNLHDLVDRDNFEKSYNLQRKELKDINKNNYQTLVNDPLGIGISPNTKENNIIAPEIREALKNVKNVLIEKDGDISYKLNLPDTFKKLEEAKKKILEGNNSNADFLTITKTLLLAGNAGGNNNPLSNGGGLVVNSFQKICEEQKQEKPNTVIISEILELIEDNLMSTDSIIETRTGDNEYKVQIADFLNPIEIMKAYNIPSDLKVFTKNLGDHPRNIFSSLVLNNFKKGIKKESHSAISNQEFKTYLEKTAFDGLTEIFTEQVNLQISKSKFFKKEEFDKIKLTSDLETSEDICPPPNVRDSLLETEDFKNSQKDLQDAVKSVCNDNDPFELSSKASLVQLLSKVYVIDYVLRTLFAFSEFRLQDILLDDIFIDFISIKIQKDLENDDFYNRILNIAKQTHEIKKDIPLNPQTNQEPINEPMEGFEEDNPDFQSGLSQFKQTIRKQIVNISAKIEKELNIKNKKSIHDKLISEWLLSPLNVQKSINDNRFLFNGIPVLSRFEKDTIYLEKYIRVLRDRGREVDIVETIEQFRGGIKSEFLPKGQRSKCGKFGLRLMYIPSIESGNEFSKLIKKYNIQSDSKLSSKEKMYFSENNKIFTIPLAVIEDDQLLDSIEDFTFDQNKKLRKLMNNMLKTKEWQLLFTFVFPLQRYLTLSLIYTSMLTTFLIKNVENAFNGSKQIIQELFNSVDQSQEDWWKKDSEEFEGKGGNAGLLKDSLDNMTASGPPNLLAVALRTIPILFRGISSQLDPSFILMQQLGIETKLSNLIKVAPLNIFGIPPFGIGFGPPITPYGLLALSTDQLNGEKKKENEENISGEEDCEEE